MRSRRQKQEHAVPEENTPGDLSFSLTRVAIAQICKSVGFKSTQLSSLDVLTEVVVRYVLSVAKSAGSSANSSSRTESNIFDVLCGIEDVHLVFGFRGASHVHKGATPLGTSGFARELIQFVKDSRGIPFAKPLPGSAAQSSSQSTEHDDRIAPVDGTYLIPGWLPALPDVSTHPEKKRHVRPLWGEMNAVEIATPDQTICQEKKTSGDPGPKEVDRPARMVKWVGNGVALRLRNVVSYGEKRVYCDTVHNDEDIDQSKKRKRAGNV